MVKVCGAILSGGKSTRMGQDKSLLTLEGKTVIEQISNKVSEITNEIIIIANDLEKYSFLNIPIYKDRYVDKGPLAGIESALFNSKADYCLLSACDTPFISVNVYKYLIELCKENRHIKAFIPKYNNQFHPLSGIYHKDVLKEVQTSIEQNDLRVISFFDRIEHIVIDDFSHLPKDEVKLHFYNMNHPHEYEWAKSLNYKF